MLPPVIAAYSAVKLHYGTVLGDEIYERIDSLPKTVPYCNSIQRPPSLTRNHKMAEGRLSTNMRDYFKIKFFLVLGDVS